MSYLDTLITDLRHSKPAAAGFVSEGLFWGTFAGLVPDIKAAIDASDGQFGLAMFFASLGAVAAMWLAPRVDAKLGNRAMQGAALAMALAFLLPGLASSVAFFTLAMVLASASSGSLDVIMNTRLSGIEADTNRSLMNLNHALFSFAYAGAALCTGLFREAGFQPFFVFVIMSVLVFMLIPVMFHKPVGFGEGEAQEPLKVRTALIFFGGAIILVAFMSEQATEAWSALHLERGLGGSAAQGALGPAILGLTMGVGRLSGQCIAAHVRETVVLQIAAVIAASGLYIAAGASNLTTAYIGFGILGLGVSVMAQMAYSAVGKRVSNQQRALVITRISVIGYMGFFVGPPLMGGLSEAFGLATSFYTISAILLIVSAVLAPGLRKQ
jgi:MFS family permease